MEPNKNNALSDDEDDLETLRLAALQTLKKSNVTSVNEAKQEKGNITFNHNFGGSNFSKRRRGFHGNRPPKNGQFRTKVRSSNLISIPVVGSDENAATLQTKLGDTEPPPKLILPQDRYCNPKVSERISPGKTSKFDRYDKSESESEFDDVSECSEPTSPGKLERANSLEALMQELENEIQGNPKPEKPKSKSKQKKSRKNKADLVSESTTEQSETENIAHNATKLNANAEVISKDMKVDSESSKVNGYKDSPKNPSKLPSADSLRVPLREKSPILPPRQSERSLSPRNQRSFRRSRSPAYRPISPEYFSEPSYVPSSTFPRAPLVDSFIPSINPFLPYNSLSYNPLAISNLPIIQNNFSSVYSSHNLQHPRFTSAPLSPRSAQFVLQNQKIIEKRKMSPRRSYSRSLSPDSICSHRSPSLTKSDRSISPRSRPSRRQSSDRRPLSPHRRPFSPERRPLSQDRRTSPYSLSSPSRLKGSRHTSPNVKSGNRQSSPMCVSPAGKILSRKSSPNRRASPCNKRVSPKRRLSPVVQSSPNRKMSPIKQLSPNHRISSPVRRTSPTRSHASTRKVFSPRSPQGKSTFVDAHKQTYKSPKSSVYDRLGSKKEIEKSKKRSRSRSLTPEKSTKMPKVETDNKRILEARRRKFESSEIPKEGIIRLKVKSEDDDKKSKVNEDNKNHEPRIIAEDTRLCLNEDELLDGDGDDIAITKIDDIFPEDESDEENEGRFKSTGSQTRSVSVLPFTKLLNGSVGTSKVDALEKQLIESKDRNRKDRGAGGGSQTSWKKDRREGKHDRTRITDEYEKLKKETRGRSRSPLRVFNEKSPASRLDDQESQKQKSSSSNISENSCNTAKPSNVVSKSVLKGKISLKGSYNKTERKVPVSTLLENKKIEIKIRNPSKYEGESRSYDVLNKDQLEERERKEKKSSRKVVEVPKAKDSLEFDEPEPEIIVDYEQDDDEDIINKNEAGDLRAQLSRKRAERQKLPLESVQSRLLQNALQGAVYKKEKKSRSKKRNKEAAPKEGKLPIHMRLGIPKGEVKSKRKRSKNRSNVDQV